MTPILNRHLWLLTGRCNDFVTPTLNSDIRYGDAVPSPAVVEARKLLYLGDKTTDYYVIAAMAALAAAKAVTGEDNSTLFLPGNLRIKPPTIAGGELRPAGPDQPTLLHRPTALPAARRWYVVRLTDELVRISTETGYRAELPFRLAAGVVYIDWPSEIGFRAAFAPDGGVWVVGTQVIICAEPSGYPFPAVAEAIRQSNQLISLMADHGTLAAFHSSQNSLQKVGALTSAVVKWGEIANLA